MPLVPLASSGARGRLTHTSHPATSLEAMPMPSRYVDAEKSTALRRFSVASIVPTARSMLPPEMDWTASAYVACW